MSRYRPEIDGLRALAVLPVILFHAGFPAFSGGYVGVDVFFVISGYLITSIILNEIHKDSFSFLNFYERRARRILPALFIVTITCIPLSVWLMSPEQIRDFSQSLVAVNVFSSNILFWMESGYFSAAAELKPLLHTWSLAVEEQFYIVYPIILVAVWNRPIWVAASVAIILFISSFASSHALLTIDASASFYLFPPRAWELAVGCGIAFLFHHNMILGSLRLSNWLSGVGIFLIVLGMIEFDKDTPFPGLYALLPTVGTAVVIYCTTSTSTIGRLLSVAPLVKIGLASYSLYLWHQPILAFLRLAVHGQPSTGQLLAAILLSIALAFLSLRYIEKPFREKGKVSSRKMALLFTSVSVLMIASGLWVNSHPQEYERFYISRLSDSARTNYEMIKRARSTGDDRGMLTEDCNIWSKQLNRNFRRQFFECFDRLGPAVIVTGGSHGMDLYNALAMHNKSMFIAGLSRGYCRAHAPAHTVPHNCHYDDLASFLVSEPNQVSSLIYTQAAYGLFQGTRDNFWQDPAVNEAAVKEVIDYLQSVAAVISGPTIWVGPQLELDKELDNLDLETSIKDQVTTFPSPRNAAILLLDLHLKSIDMDDVLYVSKIDASRLLFPNDIVIDGKLTYSDNDHWSTDGERIFGRRLLESSPELAAVFPEKTE